MLMWSEHGRISWAVLIMFELCGMSPCNTYRPVRVWLLHVTFGHNCHSAGSFAALGSQIHWNLNATGKASIRPSITAMHEVYKQNIENSAHQNCTQL